MVRVIDGLLVAAVLGGAVWTYQIKHSAEQSAKRIAQLNRQIDAEQSKITLLRADWAIMTSPERLEQVVRNFQSELGLKELRSDQIITMNELPPIRKIETPRILQALGEDGAEGEALTGSVKRPELKNIPTPSPRGSR